MLWGLFPRVSVSCYCVSLDKGFWSPHYMFKCPYFTSSVHFLVFLLLLHQKNPTVSNTGVWGITLRNAS